MDKSLIFRKRMDSAVFNAILTIEMSSSVKSATEWHGQQLHQQDLWQPYLHMTWVKSTADNTKRRRMCLSWVDFDVGMIDSEVSPMWPNWYFHVFRCGSSWVRSPVKCQSVDSADKIRTNQFYASLSILVGGLAVRSDQITVSVVKRDWEGPQPQRLKHHFYNAWLVNLRYQMGDKRSSLTCQ